MEWEAKVSILVPAWHADRLRDDVKAFAEQAANMPDGSPQASALWFEMDGGNVG